MSANETWTNLPADGADAAALHARIRALVAGVLPELEKLHRGGRIHGALTRAAIGQANDGGAVLARAPAEQPKDEGNADLHAGRDAGYAAFEQYSDDPTWPCGPWTDIYALSAIACQLATGETPPSAPARWVRDEYVPLALRMPVGHDTEFLTAIDAGLRLEATARPQSLDAFALSLGLDSLSPPAVAAEEPAPSPRPPVLETPQAPAEAEPARPAVPIETAVAQAPATHRLHRPAIVCGVLALFALSAYALWPADTEPPERIAAWQGTAAPTPAAVSAQPAIADKTPAIRAAPPAPATAPSPQATTSAAPAPASTAAPVTPLDAGRQETPAVAAAARTSVAAAVAPIAAAPLPSSSRNAKTEAPTAAAPAKAAANALTPVPVRINVVPWGEIFVDGRSRGVTPPLKSLSLKPGRYAIVVRNATPHPYRTTLVVRPGKTAAISHEFR